MKVRKTEVVEGLLKRPDEKRSLPVTNVSGYRFFTSE
jgi:hypothetical protein